MALADQLTVARIVAAPFVVVLFEWHFPGHNYWATGLFIAAMATDQVDGWLARRQNRTTPLGSLLDPVADKVLVLAAMIVLIDEDIFPGWMVAAIVAREILVSGLRLAAVERGVVISARDLGKLKTWAQAVAVAVGGFAAAGARSPRALRRPRFRRAGRFATRRLRARLFRSPRARAGSPRAPPKLAQA